MTSLDQLFPTERERLYAHFADKLETANMLNRKLVSFQANKLEPIYRWFKYKEGFSSSLVKYFLSEYSINAGKILDPFAGAGTTLFAAQELGWESYGIELLPVGVFVMEIRQAIKDVNIGLLQDVIKNLTNNLKLVKEIKIHINHISITKHAYSDETEEALNRYLTYCASIEDINIQKILKFAAFSVLEEISYTRKDGQYLRWDHRAKRDLTGKSFDKGKIKSFDEAIKNKLFEISIDILPQLELFGDLKDKFLTKHPTTIREGSCLEILPQYEDDFFDFVITSPPYCNRYDYTRTYALELVYLGYNNEQVRNLRQTMLSCTVENKEKFEYLSFFYSSIGKIKVFEKIITVYNGSKAMEEVNFVLDELNKLDKLNNSNISRMVKNYFLELCFVIYELSRVIKSKGYCVMVNDNVRYGGEEMPVDLILSEFAEEFGFEIKKILVLPKGKGNSSQQMGNFGRTETRKCVYLWQKK